MHFITSDMAAWHIVVTPKGNTMSLEAADLA